MANFSFTKVSNTSGPYSVFRNPSINDVGTVVFEAFIAVDTPPTGILTGSGGSTTTIAEGSAPIDVVFNPSINKVETTAYAGVGYTGEAGILTSSGGSITNLVNSSGHFSFFSSTSIKNRGTTAFLAGLDTGDTGIFTSSSGELTMIASSGDRFSAFDVGLSTEGGDGIFAAYTLPLINDEGTVAFNAGLDTGDTGIFISNEGEITTLADSSSRFNAFGSAAVNDEGTVAFLAELDGGDRGIFTGSGSEIATIVDDSGLFSYFNSNPSINKLGTVAFEAELDAGGSGIFIGPDPIVDKVILIGDSLFGSTVTELFISQKGLNDAGQLAFQATLADGNRAVFRVRSRGSIISRPSQLEPDVPL